MKGRQGSTEDGVQSPTSSAPRSAPPGSRRCRPSCHRLSRQSRPRSTNPIERTAAGSAGAAAWPNTLRPATHQPLPGRASDGAYPVTRERKTRSRLQTTLPTRIGARAFASIRWVPQQTTNSLGSGSVRKTRTRATSGPADLCASVASRSTCRHVAAGRDGLRGGEIASRCGPRRRIQRPHPCRAQQWDSTAAAWSLRARSGTSWGEGHFAYCAQRVAGRRRRHAAG